MSIFPDSVLGVDNPQSREEDEELEEQRRRQEELTDLLAAGIHAFNYDDSTMNSSLTSAEGAETNYHQDQTTNKIELKYDDSQKSLTNNISVNLSDALEQTYKNISQQEQLKVLYDVRVREINSLREELTKFRDEKAKEINVLKNKITLSEAEIRHLQVSLSNSESLLVEKNGIIKNLKDSIDSRDQEIEKLKKLLDEQNFEICTYRSTVNELQMKLADSNPFAANSRKLNSEELQRAHKDQILKLETLLQEQTKKAQILEKEKLRLEDDVKKLIKDKNEIEEENNLTIVGLSKKLQNTQQQCKDLFSLGEAVKKESDHFKARLQQLELNKLDLSGDGFQIKKMDKETMTVHMEKLKRMLLDKESELNTLRAKLKFYDSDLNELFEYRQLLSNMYSYETKPCSNSEHEELIIFMQRQLQSYEQAVEDRNKQIMNLNLVNKELEEKIEEMIQQTRTDIQNISQKYSLPQLETMSNELKNAHETIHSLQRQLLERGESERDDQDAVTKLEQARKENEKLQQVLVKEKSNFEKMLSEMKQEFKKADEEKHSLQKQIEDFKKRDSHLIEENERVRTQIQKICLKLGLSEADIFESDSDVHEINSLKTKYGRLHDQLQQLVVHLENMSPKRTKINIILKLKKQIQSYLNILCKQKTEQKEIAGELEQWDNMLSDFIESLRHGDSTLQANMKEVELKDNIDDLTNAKTMLEGEKFALEYQLTSRTHELEEAKKEISLLNENRDNLIKESENNARIIQHLTDQINKLEKCLEIVESNKLELEKQLDNTQKQLNDAKQETIDVHKEANVVNENAVRKNLFKELNDIESILEDDKNKSDISSSDVFQKCLQAQILKAEIILRERLQEENLKKMQKIEGQYKNVIAEKSEMYSKEKEKWRHQEANYRKQFAAVLDECGKKMQELENDNVSLIKRINAIAQEYKSFRINATNHIEKCNKMVVDSKKSVEDSNKKWSTLLEQYMVNATKIEKQGHKTVKNVLKKITLHQTEINLIESMYEEKIKKIKCQRMNKENNM